MTTQLHNRLRRVEHQFYRKADLAAIVPPRELLPYLKGELVDADKEVLVKQKFREWKRTVITALERGTVSVEEVWNVFPDPFRKALAECIRRQIGDASEETNIA
ncbi:MAG: hypothetical protein SWH61_12985 [Thermodesulfobacteriota bacterium]|nr:hypothetical protein [Thermodesulfobacteriota bacterium]